MVCDKCGYKYSDENNFCPNCGNAQPTVTYCRFCGNRVENNNFCPVCGKSSFMPSDYGVVRNASPMCGTALAGCITGICSLIIDPIGLVALTAIILSSVGLNKVKEGNLAGKGWAICGLVCGIIEFVLKYRRLNN